MLERDYWAAYPLVSTRLRLLGGRVLSAGLWKGREAPYEVEKFPPSQFKRATSTAIRIEANALPGSPEELEVVWRNRKGADVSQSYRLRLRKSYDRPIVVVIENEPIDAECTNGADFLAQHSVVADPQAIRRGSMKIEKEGFPGPPYPQLANQQCSPSSGGGGP